MTREPIYSALFAKLQSVAGIITCSRRLQHWSNCPDDQQPAIFMAQGDQVADHQGKGIPYKWELNISVYVYVRVNEGAAPAPVLNPILDQIESILNGPVGMAQTLGGLCDVCYIDGAIQTFEGTLGEQEVAIIPIKILVR
jgi:hypothetical protein